MPACHTCICTHALSRLEPYLDGDARGHASRRRGLRGGNLRIPNQILSYTSRASSTARAWTTSWPQSFYSLIEREPTSIITTRTTFPLRPEWFWKPAQRRRGNALFRRFATASLRKLGYTALHRAKTAAASIAWQTAVRRRRADDPGLGSAPGEREAELTRFA